MPKLDTDYSKTIIYTIKPFDETLDFCYVGSTTDFIRRKYMHKSNCNNDKQKMYNYKLYKTIREHGGWDNFEMKPYCEYPCENKIQAEIKEREIFDILKPNLNSQYPVRNDKEYREHYKDKIKEYLKEYRKQNKDKIKEYREQNKDKIKEYQLQKFECECGGHYLKCSKARHIKTKKHQDYLSKHKIEDESHTSV